mmetsp:Transcript_5645/g.6380  ORF Transcript_5645/g.6380 Transcript_5645/m.6380 type:complete len:89 (-) Transcript_5645:1156-1422(-)
MLNTPNSGNKNRLILLIILASGVSFIMGYFYTTFAYYPKLAHKRGIDQQLLGVILAMDSLPFMIFSLISPILMKKYGRKVFLVIPLLL